MVPGLEGPHKQRLDFQISLFVPQLVRMQAMSCCWYVDWNSENPSRQPDDQTRIAVGSSFIVVECLWKGSQLLFCEIFGPHWSYRLRAEGIPCMSKCAESCINNGTDRSRSKLQEARTACVAKWQFHFKKLQTINAVQKNRSIHLNLALHGSLQKKAKLLCFHFSVSQFHCLLRRQESRYFSFYI